MRDPFHILAATMLAALLAACSAEPAPEQTQRISMEAARQNSAQPIPSPDTSEALWRVDANGHTIRFGVVEDGPMLSLACDLSAKPEQIRVIRHVQGKPGQTALFPVIGNGRISRFLVDARLNEGEWRWEGSLPAADEQLEVFAGPRDVEATLPGGGTLLIGGSSIPGEFVNWCRAGGKAPGEAEVSEPAPIR